MLRYYSYLENVALHFLWMDYSHVPDRERDHQLHKPVDSSCKHLHTQY